MFLFCRLTHQKRKHKKAYSARITPLKNLNYLKLKHLNFSLQQAFPVFSQPVVFVHYWDIHLRLYSDGL